MNADDGDDDDQVPYSNFIFVGLQYTTGYGYDYLVKFFGVFCRVFLSISYMRVNKDDKINRNKSFVLYFLEFQIKRSSQK